MNAIVDYFGSFKADHGNITLLFILILIGVIYFLPSLIALLNHKRQFLAIFLLNLFAGWTILVWFGTLIWAALKERQDEHVD